MAEGNGGPTSRERPDKKGKGTDRRKLDGGGLISGGSRQIHRNDKESRRED